MVTMPACKCTPEITAEFAKLIRAGNYFETAAAFLGIYPKTAYRWLQRGEAAIEAATNEEGTLDEDAITGNERCYARFYVAVTEADAAAEVRNLAIVQQAAQDRPRKLLRRNEETGEVEELQRGDWSAAAWWLEKRKQFTWGMRRTKAEVSAAVTIVPVFGAEDPLGGGEHHGPDADDGGGNGSDS
jgi:hypothetical protein